MIHLEVTQAQLLQRACNPKLRFFHKPTLPRVGADDCQGHCILCTAMNLWGHNEKRRKGWAGIWRRASCQAAPVSVLAIWSAFPVAVGVVLVPGDAGSSFLALFCFLRSALQRSLHVFTSSQHRSHTLRQEKGRLHTSQSLEGKFSLFTPRGIALHSLQPYSTSNTPPTVFDLSHHLPESHRQQLQSSHDAGTQQSLRRVTISKTGCCQPTRKS